MNKHINSHLNHQDENGWLSFQPNLFPFWKWTEKKQAFKFVCNASCAMPFRVNLLQLLLKNIAFHRLSSSVSQVCALRCLVMRYLKYGNRLKSYNLCWMNINKKPKQNRREEKKNKGKWAPFISFSFPLASWPYHRSLLSSNFLCFLLAYLSACLFFCCRAHWK